jgi:hypothetical protein
MGHDIEDWRFVSTHIECVNHCFSFSFAGCTAYVFYENGVCAVKYGFSRTSDASRSPRPSKCGLVTNQGWTVTSLHTYASNCEFRGNDLVESNRASSENECANSCIRLARCTAYTFFQNGICALKYGFSKTTDAFITTEMSKCGLVTSKIILFRKKRFFSFLVLCNPNFEFGHEPIQKSGPWVRVRDPGH